MGARTLERTAFFADIASSTRIVIEEGDDAARVVLVRCVGLLAEVARRARGEVANLLGDGIFCIFANAEDAAGAAAAMHEALEASSSRERLARPLRVRIGFVHGSMVRSDEGWFGNTVHKASRVAALAKAEQTLTTRGTLDRLSPRWQRVARFYDRSVLRGSSGEEDLYEILWDTSITSAVPVGRELGGESGSVAVELTCGAKRLRVDAVRPHVELGRDPASDLHVPSSGVSRLHAVIEWNRGRVQLSDVSTNGTTVERAGHGRRHVHHDTVQLEGEGVLWLGAESVADAQPIAYRCLRAE